MSVRMENVSCSAQGAVLVEGVSLEVRPGECVLLCGPCLLYTSDAADEL